MKKRRMALSCSKRNVYIIKRNNIKTSWRFLCLNCLHSLRKDFCGIAIPSGKDKMPYIYADIASLIKKIDGCANNPENS